MQRRVELPPGEDVLIGRAVAAVLRVPTAEHGVAAELLRHAGEDVGELHAGDGRVDRAELSKPARPLNKERWAGAVDVVGSHTLANVVSMTKYGGTVAACGLAGGMDLTTSVAPFILRGVTLAGIDSVMAPKPQRLEAWSRLARDLDKAKLAAMTVTRPASDVVALAPDILAGKVRGRVVLELG